MTPRRRVLCALLAACALPLQASESAALPLAADLRDAQAGPVVLVLFSLPGCHYCEAVRREHLVPMRRDGRFAGRIEILEVDMASDAALRDFSGALLTHQRFAARHGVKIAPTVMALARSGALLGEPIVGAKIADFYGYYLDALVERALAAQGRR